MMMMVLVGLSAGSTRLDDCFVEKNPLKYQV